MHPSFAAALDHPIDAPDLVGETDQVQWFRNTRGRPSADLFAELDEFYRLTERVIEAAGGLVIKFIGDGVLIAFPKELADPGIIALLRLKQDAEAWFRTRGIDSGLHVNVHFGEVTMGKMGSVDRLDIIGETVNICASLPHQGVTLTPQAFRCLSSEHRKLFHRFIPPVTYHPE
ncbi:MAG: adenylate/guanylate cyclase domain-containing protein [Chloroflexi bacterium]|nr:adenylate/guanylate cyclase domain-containing protein [Chloroflexota bacterium]